MGSPPRPRAAFWTSPVLASLDSVVETVGRARPVLSATWPAVIASPPASAASTEALVAPGAVLRDERAAGLGVRRAVAVLAAGAVGLVAGGEPGLEAVRGLRAGGLRVGAAEERGSSAASALRSRSASWASWSRRSWICSRRRSITFHFLAVGGWAIVQAVTEAEPAALTPEPRGSSAAGLVAVEEQREILCPRSQRLTSLERLSRLGYVGLQPLAVPLVDSREVSERVLVDRRVALLNRHLSGAAQVLDGVTVRTQRDQADDPLTRWGAGFVVLVALVYLDRVTLADAAADLAAVAGGVADEFAFPFPHRPAHDGARVLAVQARRNELYGQLRDAAHVAQSGESEHGQIPRAPISLELRSVGIPVARYASSLTFPSLPPH